LRASFATAGKHGARVVLRPGCDAPRRNSRRRLRRPSRLT
jgi:hypothetical protein